MSNSTLENKAIMITTKNHKIQAFVFLVVFLFVMAGSALGSIFLAKKYYGIDSTTFNPKKMDASIRPAGDTLTGITIPESNDSDGMIACALNLYTIANYNLQHDDKVAYAVNTKSEVLYVSTGGIRYTVKNGDEFFNADYFYVPQGGLINTIAKKASPEFTNYGYRAYYNLATQSGREQKAKELNYKVLSNGVIGFRVLWDNLYFDREITEIPQEFAASGKSYRYYNYTWSVDSLLSASVKYNAKGGYYELKVEIDCSNEEAIKDGLAVLRQGANDPNAVYTKIVETVQIWDNGRFKIFNTYDDWYSPHIHNTSFSATSANDYRTTFYYDDYSLNISNYQYAKEYIDSLAA